MTQGLKLSVTWLAWRVTTAVANWLEHDGKVSAYLKTMHNYEPTCTIQFMSEESQIKQVMNNPQAAAKLVDILVSKRPQGWGRRSIAPYFNHKYGAEMIITLDTMMQSQQDMVFNYDHFKAKFGLSKTSLYLRVNQSMKYVCEKMDTPDHKYARFCETLTVERKRDVGVIIRFRPELRDGFQSEFSPMPVMGKEELPVWKEKLDDYLATAQPGDDPLLIERLALTPMEIQQVRTSLQGLKGIISNVSSYSIKVIRINEEEL